VPRPSLRLVLPVAAAKLLVHLVWVNGYGYFRDELYYLACARRLAWGYVDHPPLSIAVLAVDRAVLGDSRLALRLVPALAGAAVVLLTGWLARELGGGRAAMVLASVAALVAPMYLALDHFYSMNALDVLFWTAGVCLVARILRDPPAATWRIWALLGLVLGLGLLDKASVLWLMGGVAAGLLLTRHRRLVATRGPWIALAVAGAIAALHVRWQVVNGFPTREFVQHATADKMAPVSALSFFRSQIEDMHPLNALVWLPGLGALLLRRRLAAFRPLGIAYAAIFGLLVLNGKARSGYLAPMYPVLFAAGGVLLEDLTARRRWIAPAFAVVLVAGGVATAPLALPCLPLDRYLAYAAALGQRPSTEEKKEVGALPQFYADMFGWPEMTEAVTRVVGSLTPDERAHAVVRANDYGQAGAFEFFGRGLPPIACGHNNWWLWGPGNPDASVEVRIGRDEDAAFWRREVYDDVQERGAFENPWVMPYENHLKIWVCRRPRQTLGERWPDAKHYD
jgi:hypothetical protein